MKEFFKFKGMPIQARLRKAFTFVIIIATIAALVGTIAIYVISDNYKIALHNYALPQGKIGMLMNEHAECRSAMRGIIGYEYQEQIDIIIHRRFRSVLQNIPSFLC